jgi:hypothetical protein
VLLAGAHTNTHSYPSSSLSSSSSLSCGRSNAAIVHHDTIMCKASTFIVNEWSLDGMALRLDGVVGPVRNAIKTSRQTRYQLRHAINHFSTSLLHTSRPEARTVASPSGRQCSSSQPRQ